MAYLNRSVNKRTQGIPKKMEKDGQVTSKKMVKWNKNTVRFYLLLVPISDCQTNCWCVRVRGFQSICCIFLKIRRPQISRLIINCRLLVFMFLFAFDSFVEIPINNTVNIIIHRCFLLLTYKAGYSPSTSLAGPLARNGSGPVSRNGSGPLGPLSRSNSLCGHPFGQGTLSVEFQQTHGNTCCNPLNHASL